MLAAAFVAMHMPRTEMAHAHALRDGRLATIRGVVYDSVSLRPLPSARVDLVEAGNVAVPTRSVETDSLDAFRLEAIGAGR